LLPKMIEIIKKAATDAVDAASPVAVLFGTVTSVSPLVISVEQKINLRGEHLILTANAQNLNMGDTALLLRVQGGQRYVVLEGKVNT